jgi:hypothetical protein
MAARSPDSQTVELDREYLDTVTFQGREYQKYSIEHRTYFGPVDEVRGPDFHRRLIFSLTAEPGRSTTTRRPTTSFPKNFR